MKYNDNITLLWELFPASACSHPPLEPDQYYALMVIDYDVARNRQTSYWDTREFFDKTRGWLGLEHMTGGAVYISKTYQQRATGGRGHCWIVRVANPALCREL